MKKVVIVMLALALTGCAPAALPVDPWIWQDSACSWFGWGCGDAA